MRNFRLIISCLGGIMLLAIMLPLGKMVVSAFLHPAALYTTLAEQEVYASILLSLRCALWATAGCLILGVPLAYALARWDFPAKSIIQGIIDLPLMIPHTAAGIALLMVYGHRFFMGRLFAKVGISVMGTEFGISLAMAFVSLPFLINAARDGFIAVDPRLERVARTLGASPWQVFFKVSLPLAWRSILSGAILMWARGIAEFGAVVILAYHPRTAPVLIWDWFNSYGLKYASPVAVLLILICLVIFTTLRWLAAKNKEL